MYGPHVKARRWAMSAFGAAVFGALVAAFTPLGQMCTAISSSDGGRGPDVAAESCRGVSTFSTDGAWVLVVVLVPALMALIGTLVDRRPAQVVAAVLLWIGCLVALASVGLYFVPAAILMTVAAAQSRPVPATPPIQRIAD